MENKFVEFIENNKKVIISSVAVGVVLVLGFGWYSYNQQQAEQQAKIVQLEKDSKSDKEQVDKLFESFDASSDESISKLKELSETSLKTDAGKDYLNNKVKESSKAIVDFHLQKGLAYDVKDSDDKFKDKTTLETNVKEITKQIDVLKKEEEQKASDKAKEDKKKEEPTSSQSSNSLSESSSSSSSSSNSYSAPEQTYTSDNSGSYSGSTGGDNSNYKAPAATDNGGNDGYILGHVTDADGSQRDFYFNRSNGDVRDTSGNHVGNFGGGIVDFRQR
ncbi:hypothetical protein OK353_09660 [Streptococcus pneumoniae]|nr:hypothetical protein [Streptococcus pneumoniae]